jgi:hypothetical protein
MTDTRSSTYLPFATILNYFKILLHIPDTLQPPYSCFYYSPPSQLILRNSFISSLRLILQTPCSLVSTWSVLVYLFYLRQIPRNQTWIQLVGDLRLVIRTFSMSTLRWRLRNQTWIQLVGDLILVIRTSSMSTLRWRLMTLYQQQIEASKQIQFYRYSQYDVTRLIQVFTDRKENRHIFIDSNMPSSNLDLKFCGIHNMFGITRFSDVVPISISYILHSMALGSTQPLTEMSTRNFPGSKGRPASKADNLTAIFEPIV